MSNGLDPDQAPRFVDPNCLHNVSADGTSRKRVKRCTQLTTVSLVLSHLSLVCSLFVLVY